jgi:CRISPR-associated protein Cas2
MTTERRNISEYRGVWLFAMFDLPVDDKEARKRYTQFRRALIQDGFLMMQYSVYARYCPSEEASDVHRKRIKQALPPAGNVRVLGVTDRQYGKMEVFFGRKQKSAEEPPEQILLL